MAKINFDTIDDWASPLHSVLQGLLPKGIENILISRRPEYFEDALDAIFEISDRNAIINTTLDWVRSETIVGYHGTRLTPEEIESIRERGLLPLDASARRIRLTRALSEHPQWQSVSSRLDEALEKHGRGQRAGGREGQVHLTLSRSGLVNGFNHYLSHGSEFDQHVAHYLLGDEGKELLREDGAPTLLNFAVPGDVALEVAHPFFGIDDVLRQGDVPNIVSEFLKSWSYALAHPGFQSSALRVDCGLFFRRAVPPDWLVAVEPVAYSNDSSVSG
jgi:hypothetical protein